jgi:phage shock protein PspC (stress-responsive transcriptional regulator)
MNVRHLYRCRHDRKLAGVAGGMAEYLELDPTLLRVLWVISIFFGGFSILLYIILAFVMPSEPDDPAPGPGLSADLPPAPAPPPTFALPWADQSPAEDDSPGPVDPAPAGNSQDPRTIGPVSQTK